MAVLDDIGLSVRNILGDDYEATQTFDDGVATFDSYNLGRTFSASIKRNF